MSVVPIITFKAGICELDISSTPPRVKPKPTPGYIYLYSEDDLIHFCWRPRSAPLTEPELDLVMVPTDGSFLPYQPSSGTEAPTNGRIYVLKFSSSSQRHLFWLQAKSQHERGDPSFFSARDFKLGEIVNDLLQGEQVDVQHELANLPRGPSNEGDDDETMEDVEGVHHDPSHNHGGSSGGAGADATGGDVREEGEESREGGADGGRAATTSSYSPALVQDFLKSLQGGVQAPAQGTDRPTFTLQDLLTPSSTLPFVDSADEETIDNLLSFLPPSLPLLAQELDDVSAAEANPELAEAILQSLDLSQKKSILKRILHSPQFMQSLVSLTVALRDGGLPSISEGLRIPVENGGFMRRGGVPLGGSQAMEAFLEGIRKCVQEKQSAEREPRMETD